MFHTERFCYSLFCSEISCEHPHEDSDVKLNRFTRLVQPYALPHSCEYAIVALLPERFFNYFKAFIHKINRLILDTANQSPVLLL